jgi:hypothetical protein
MSFQVNNNAAVAGSSVSVKNSAGTAITQAQTATYAGGNGILTVYVTWASICSSVSGGDANCSTGTSQDLSVGFDSIGNPATTDYTTVTVRASAVDLTATHTNWFNTDCPDVNNIPTTSNGFCHFTAFPGDEKLYALNLTGVSTYPTSPTSGINFDHIVFFYEAQTAADGGNAGTIARITNSSEIFSISTNSSTSAGSTSGSFNVDDNRITGLTNGTTYCAIMANQDQTGNIYFMTDTTATGFDNTTICAPALPVEGLLDDKHCFIATAAFGSMMAPEVQSFRDFRNHYLMTNSVGRAFVKFYYDKSPKYARMIAGSEIAKATARGFLWPLLAFTKIVNAWGMSAAILVLMLLLAAIAMPIYVWRKKSHRGEA